MSYETALLGIIAILIVITVFFYVKYLGIQAENKALKEIVEVNAKTIENLKASRVAVKEVIENFSSHEDVMKLRNAGKSVAEIAEMLKMPENKVEMIIKFDKIKKEKSKPLDA